MMRRHLSLLATTSALACKDLCHLGRLGALRQDYGFLKPGKIRIWRICRRLGRIEPQPFAHADASEQDCEFDAANTTIKQKSHRFLNFVSRSQSPVCQGADLVLPKDLMGLNTRILAGRLGTRNSALRPSAIDRLPGWTGSGHRLPSWQPSYAALS